jgi:hypothetical protein
VVDGQAGGSGAGEEQDQEELVTRVQHHARTIARDRRRG